MRKLALIAAIFLAASASADNLWFDPPNPTSQTPVMAHVLVNVTVGCSTGTGSAQRIGANITITVQFPPCGAFPVLGAADVPVDLGILPPGVYAVVAVPGLIGAATLVVQDAQPELRVSPNVSEYGLVDPITIKGAGIAVCSDAACTPPVVTFGGVQADFVQRVDDDTIGTAAPRRDDSAAVDVAVTNGDKTWRATAAFDYFGLDHAFNPAFFEPVLFPVMINGPGAFGSEWETDAILRNENDYQLPIYSIFDFQAMALSPPQKRPHAHETAYANGIFAPNGYLMWLPRESAPRLSFGLLVKDLSRQSEAFGTQIPVVREKDFLNRPFTILNVPTDPRYRVALRLYRIDGGTSLHVRVSPLAPTDAPLVDEDVSLSVTNSGGKYAMLTAGDLLARYPQLAGKGPLRIEIDPYSPQRGSWGFVSVTNNATQHVTVISPQ